MAAPEVREGREQVHRRQAARHRRDSLKDQVRDNVLVEGPVAQAVRAARQPEAADRAWLT